MFHIVLLEPEIPANTGNIGRTCLVTGSKLHLIEPMGFLLNDKNLKRAGMDYWKDIDVQTYDCFRDFRKAHASFFFEEPQGTAPREDGAGLPDHLQDSLFCKTRPAQIWYATTKARQTYCDVQFQDGDYIMFGRESAGIPEELLLAHPERCIRIPMGPAQRSLNLSNSVAIVLYEALRQNAFSGLEREGQLHEHSW